MFNLIYAVKAKLPLCSNYEMSKSLALSLLFFSSLFHFFFLLFPPLKFQLSLSGFIVMVLKKLLHSITLPTKFSHLSRGKLEMEKGWFSDMLLVCLWFSASLVLPSGYSCICIKAGCRFNGWPSTLFVAYLFIIPNKSEVSNMEVTNGSGVSACQVPRFFDCVAPASEGKQGQARVSAGSGKSLGALPAPCAFQEALDRYRFESPHKKLSPTF